MRPKLKVSLAEEQRKIEQNLEFHIISGPRLNVNELTSSLEMIIMRRSEQSARERNLLHLALYRVGAF